ncbi:histidine phosphatase family protein [Streptomyces sp. NRRL S-31]|uniref:histidine phosphatase family protein n=1 Tax=Streptomyces sp. NRRL S-31 TaxID=1463898 RepID=UPI0004CA7635|nr:histidine phosphatase family protein [Streptomyces sp. NRRL S-31]
MTDFVLVRHGETVWHADNRYAGRTDVPLTARGRRQAAELGAWAAGQRLDAVLCSPLSRARLTAEPAAAALGLIPRVDERLYEVDFGRGDGLTRAEMAEAFPEALAAFLADPVAHHLPGGEDPAAAADRAVGCLRETAHKLPDGRVLVVAHSTLLRLVLCELLGIPLAGYRRVFPRLDNGALTELRLGDDRAALLRFNAPVR